MTQDLQDAQKVMGRPPHLSDPSAIMYVWFTQPPGMVDSLGATHMDHKAVAWLTTTATDAMWARYGRPAPPIVFVHHWANARSYDLAARARLVTWGLTMGPKAIHSINIVLGPHSPAMVRMACSAGTVPFALAGITMGVEENLAATVSRLGLRAAP